MQANDVLIDDFGRVKEIVRAAVDGLSEEYLAFRPGADANSIVWLVWHLTRVQDGHLAELEGNEQVWVSGGWQEKFALPLDEMDTGYGHSSEQVAQVRASAKLLAGYHEAVCGQTVAYLKTLSPEDYDEVIDENWTPPVTRGVRLVSVTSDNLQHAGQAAYVRGLLAK
jgi:uncharacterized damage-inducible protein DinB